jgi:hypothetical protein
METARWGGSMATIAPVQKKQNSNHDDLDRLAEDFFNLAESQLEKMETDEREGVIASIHATAESLRTEK